MSIWGHRDSEPPAEGTHESPSPAQAAGEPGAGAQAEPGVQAGTGPPEEPAPAFWRAQGETPASFERSPADAPPLADAPPPAHGEVPDGPPAPAGGRAAPAPDDMVVLDGPAAGEPVLAGAAQEPAEPEPAEPEPAEPEPAEPEPAELGPATPEAGVPEAVAPGAAANGAHVPPAAGMPPQAVPAVAADVHAAAPVSPTGISPQRWSEILAAFVDDPRGSVKMAADAVEEAIDEFVNSVRARQRALESSWHGAGTDTEQLRTALRDYRRFWHQVEHADADPAAKTGA